MPVTNKLKEFREQKMQHASDPSQWTQESIGNRVGVTRQTIISIEKGTYNPSLELAFRLACLFDVRIEDLFQFECDKNER